MNILIAKKTLHQLNMLGKNYNPAFLGDKNFTEDKNGNRPLSRQNYWQSYNTAFPYAPFTMRNKATEYTKHSF
jgi:hypothetical protein